MGGPGPENPLALRADYLRLKGALHDRNTGLVSYHAYFTELRSHFEDTPTLGVLTVDLADFGQVESIYGWQVFDRILNRVAGLLEAMRGGLLPADFLLTLDGVAAGRFVLFLHHDGAGGPMTSECLEMLAASLGNRLQEGFSGDDFRTMTPRIRFEQGTCLLQDDPFLRFERQLYGAVDHARRQSFVHAERQRSRDTDELRRIVQEGALQVLFQPIHCLDTGEVVGFEALSRGPEDGPFQEPQAMFEASRLAGLETELDALCQRRAILGARNLEAGKKLFINVLASTLVDETTGPPAALEWIDRSGLERSSVVIEISERGPVLDRPGLQAALSVFRKAGVGLALDDIGTGLTGLQAIEEMRPDYLKLDVSLVRNIDTNLITQEMLRTLTEIARSLGSDVVGEGVETEQEKETLQDCGTTLAQGFLFSRPRPTFGASA